MKFIDLIKNFVNLFYAPEDGKEADTTDNSTYVFIFVVLIILIIIAFFAAKN